MATINLPSWFDVLECEAALQPEVRGFVGPFGGPTELQDLLGDRWRFRLTLPDGDFTWGGRTEALFNRLRGGADWLRLHHFARPVPAGTLRGAPTLSATAAQGASALTLQAASTGRPIRMPQGLDGSAWVQQGCTVTADALAGPDLTMTADAVVESSGTGGGNGHGVRQTVTLSAGTWVLSWYLRALERTRCSMWAFGGPVSDVTSAVYDTTTVAASGTGSPTITADDNLYFRCTRVITLATGGSLTIHIGPQDAGSAQAYTGDGVSRVAIWGVQLDAGGVAGPYAGRATLKAGDMLGHNGEQLFQVFEDATATDLDVLSCTIVGRLRKAIASGQAIVWDKPSLPFQLLDTSGVPTSYTRGRARGQQVEFVEAWQA